MECIPSAHCVSSQGKFCMLMWIANVIIPKKKVRDLLQSMNCSISNANNDIYTDDFNITFTVL